MAAFMPIPGALLHRVAARNGVGDRAKPLAPTALPSCVPAVAITQPRMSFAYPYTGFGTGPADLPDAGSRFRSAFPSSHTSDIIETAAAVPVFKTFIGLLRETGLDYELAKGGPFTVFAPTDAAFSELFEPYGVKLFSALLHPGSREDLRRLLSYHIVKGRISSGTAIASGRVIGESLAGLPVTVVAIGKRISAGSAPVVKADIACTNGVIHIVSSILTPSPSPEL